MGRSLDGGQRIHYLQKDLLKYSNMNYGLKKKRTELCVMRLLCGNESFLRWHFTLLCVDDFFERDSIRDLRHIVSLAYYYDNIGR